MNPIDEIKISIALNLDPPEPPSFYILWCPTSHLPPRVKIGTEAQALTVAGNMAREHKAVFHVMKAVATVSIEPAPVLIQRLRP